MGPGPHILSFPMPNDFEAVALTGASDEDVSLLDILDHVLNAGVVVHGSLVISLAGVDLVYLGLNVVLTSVETALRNLAAEQARGKRP
jgi:gas vesicle structural protein